MNLYLRQYQFLRFVHFDSRVLAEAVHVSLILFQNVEVVALELEVDRGKDGREIAGSLRRRTFLLLHA